MKERKYEIFEIISKNIKKYRNIRGYTQEELAKRSNISFEYLRRIEAPNINTTYSLDIIVAIADGLGIDLFLLFIDD